MHIYVPEVKIFGRIFVGSRDGWSSQGVCCRLFALGSRSSGGVPSGWQGRPGRRRPATGRCRLPCGSGAPTFCGCECWLFSAAGSQSWFFLGGNRFVWCRCLRLAYPLTGGNSGLGSRTYTTWSGLGWALPNAVRQVSGRDRVALRRWSHGLVRSGGHLVVCICSAGVRLVRLAGARPVSGLAGGRVSQPPWLRRAGLAPHVSRASSEAWDACSYLPVRV